MSNKSNDPMIKIAKLEANQKHIQNDMEEIKADVKAILQDMRSGVTGGIILLGGVVLFLLQE